MTYLFNSHNEASIRQAYDPSYSVHVRADISASPVQVCVDTRMLGVKGTGVAIYAEVLAECLKRMGVPPDLLSGGCDEPRPAAPMARLARWKAALKTRPRPATAERAWSALADVAAPAFSRRGLFRESQVFFNIHRRLMPVRCADPPKVMHWTYPVPLYVEGARNIYTVHDVIPLTNGTLTPIGGRRHGQLLGCIAERADRIVTVSEHARAAIVEALPIAPGHVVSLSQAVNLPLQQDPSLPDGLRPGGYFFFCGTIEPRKNLIALAQAHAASGSARPLVMVGPDGHRADLIKAALAAFPQVIVYPWQERAALVGLMRRARALLFPSLAEGFGLPIAEAMALGTPVLTSAIGATAEVAGDAALLVAPDNVPEIAEAIGRLDADDLLCARLRALGFRRAGRFSLAAYAARLHHFYTGLLSERDGVGA